MRDKRDPFGSNRIFRQQSLEAAHDTGGNTIGMIVCRRHFDGRNQLARGRVNRDDVGERSTDIDTDADARCYKNSAVGCRKSTRTTIVRSAIRIFPSIAKRSNNAPTSARNASPAAPSRGIYDELAVRVSKPARST